MSSLESTALSPPAEVGCLGIPGSMIQLIMLLATLGIFLYIIGKRAVLLRLAAPDPRFDRPWTRIRRLLTVGFGQSRQPRYKVAGILHILIFVGFLILSLRSLTLLGLGLSAGFTLPGLGGALGTAYSSLKDYTAVVVLLCCLVAAVRRLIFTPARYRDRHAVTSHSGEAYIILGLISVLMLADAFIEGSEMALHGKTSLAAPFASAAAILLQGQTLGRLNIIHLASFWIHNGVLLFFLCYLPVSKHFHVITALANVFFSKLDPGGRIKPPRHDQDDLDKLETLGVSRLEDFTWKHILDFYSCTDCGRCTDHCPAYAAGMPLSPRMISVKNRDLAYRCYPLLGRTIPENERPALLGTVVQEDELWACTTCGSCEEACPVTIEYVDKIVDMRRFLVDDGRVPASLQKPMADLEKRGNPYGKMSRKRGDWVGGKKEDGCGVRVLKKGESADILLFTDSCSAFDPRIQQIVRSMGRLLQAAGLAVGTLGKDEVDSGNEARRLGEEGLFETLRDRNRESLEEREFSRLVTADPHAFNTLAHGYGLEQPVLHHAQLLAELISANLLAFTGGGDGRTYTFHDPCYLGRHNGIYDAPRRVLSALSGFRMVEMERTRNRSFCCGGGSLYLFYEGECESRMGELRVEMAARAGAEVVVTACPFCLINLEDAIKTTGREGKMEVIDLAELVEGQLAGGNPV